MMQIVHSHCYYGNQALRSNLAFWVNYINILFHGFVVVMIMCICDARISCCTY